ncbi:MAG: PQQ-binding-like beta-propeller repeat protein [Bacteroidaceae bacterium]|nr:PQQ-binding-like beta-propeller repeat protein [Bacteroidaceae bacterium]
MNKNIFRNIAIVTAVFALALSVMLITNYFQVRGTTPLQTTVMETLKELNDSNSENVELQEQIRQLDLLARKAYFVQESHLKSGIYILLGMLGVLVVCLRYYYANAMNIPDKEIDEVDDWLIKSKARKYVTWGVCGLAAVALVLGFLSSPYYTSLKDKLKTNDESLMADVVGEEDVAFESDADEYAAVLGVTEVSNNEQQATDNTQNVENSQSTEDNSQSTAVVEQPSAVEEVELPKVTHNGFRGNNYNGQSSARGIPAKWNPGDGTNIAWRSAVPKHGFNSPVINGRNIFFSGADEASRELYCYDLFTGELRWTLAATGIPGSPSTMPRVNDDTGLAASTVATNGKQVCAIFATGDVICADMDGNKLWAKNVGVPDNHYGFASSLLIYGNLLIIQYDNDTAPKLMALSLTNGNQVWSKNRSEKATWSSPSLAYVDNKAQLIVMGNPAVTAYNPANGEQIWKVDCMSGEVGASACSANGIIFAASEYAKVVAINGADGSQLWEANDYLPEVSSPVATKDYLYVATSYGVLAAYNAQTGELVAEYDSGAQFYSSPMIVEGKIYLFDTDGKMYVFSNDGKLTLISQFATGEKTFATPAFTDGRVVVRTNNSLYCVQAN